MAPGGVDSFRMKAELNALVIRCVAEKAYGSSGPEECNLAASRMSASSVHDRLAELLAAVEREAAEQAGTV